MATALDAESATVLVPKPAPENCKDKGRPNKLLQSKSTLR